MIIQPDQFEETYRALCKTSIAHMTCKLVVFVSCLNVDALCGARMFSDLLRAQLIPHKTVPVTGYEEMIRKYRALDPEILNVFFIGFGATQDVGELLRGDDEEMELKKIYIVDGNRPWHLDNILDRNIVCFDDGRSDLEQRGELLVAYNWLNDMSAEELDALSDLEDEDEDEDEDDDEIVTRKNGHHSNSLDDSDNDSDGGDLVDTLLPSKRSNSEDLPDAKKLHSQLLSAKKQKDDFEDKIRSYYQQGTSQSSPASCMLYTLMSLIGETSITRLWLAVVGASSLDSQYPQVFQDSFPMLADEVNRVGNEEAAAQLAQNANSEAPVSEKELVTSLRLETDYSLFVLRHWNIYDSMFHTDYIWAKMKLWTEKGRQNFQKMLAIMGVSLTEAREGWIHLKVSVKQGLNKRIEKAAKVADLEDLLRPGVVRKFGYKGSLTAGDCVDAAGVILQLGMDKSPAGLDHIKEGILLTADQDYHDESQRDQFWVANFWSAWDSLEEVDTLLLGISKAKLLQQAVARTTTALIEKGQIRPVSDYLVAVVKEGPDLALFRNPLALCRLGIWIAQTKAEAHKKKYSPPLVLASLDKSTGNYMVLGMNPRQSRDYHFVVADDEEDDGRFVFNQFTQRFAKAAEDVHTRYKMDMFEMAVIEVDKHDLTRFLERLTVV
ncbi:Cell division control protein 45 [Yarrowia sp. C11]|nr:Cell division control protein 45 [Yarrowia sp. E02]KAG5373075.1 Cell division control protein 45 [Yarrowia sp. C11]